jgi:hypothetical protein
MDMLGNGVCETACSRRECNWDYRDCECDHVLDTCEGMSNDGSDVDTSYDNNLERCWLIRPKARASRIHLHWTRFDTEKGFDRVLVYDGNSQLDPPLHPNGGFSGQLRENPERFPPDIASSSGELLVRFVTDRSQSRENGFAFSWTCEGT